MKNKKKNNIPYVFAIILIVAIIFSLIIFYQSNQQGNLKIVTKEKDVTVFIDEKNKGFLNTDDKKNGFKISKGNHSLLLSKDNFWPWIKNFSINGKQTLEVLPFFVPKNTKGVLIGKTDPEYETIISLIDNNKTRIDWEKTENTPKIIFDLETKITVSDFYKDRSDVIIIAVQDGIYALEINDELTPNFQPIYKGSNPTFVKKDNNSIYIKDGGTLMEVFY